MKNIQKRLRAFVASAMMLCAILPSFAYSFEAGGFYYNITGEAEVEVTSGGTKYSGKVVIPSSVSYSGTTYSVTSIGKEAFFGCRGLTSVTIPNSVTTIGWSTFYGCTRLTSVNIPNSVTAIGKHAFYQCSGLTSVTIGNSVTEIGIEAFYDCSKLKEVHINDLSAWCKIDFTYYYDNPTYYAHKLYLNGKEITNLVIPDDIIVIKPYVFRNCSGLTSVTIPNSVAEIGREVFYQCTGLTSVTIPNSVTKIEYDAFGYCSGLTSVTIGNSVTEIEMGAFEYCTGLTSVTIPNSVTKIGNDTFSGCSGLTSVTIGNSVTEIGSWAFRGCTSLTSVTSLADVPPTCGEDVFLKVDTKNCPLYVHIGSKDAYSRAYGWWDFLNIVELSAGIDDIVSDQGNKPTEYYNLNGMRVNNPHNSIYIKRQDSKTEKVLIK